MGLNLRRFFLMLASVALLWQAMGATVVDAVGCCSEPQDCCLIANTQSACSSCVFSPAVALNTCLFDRSAAGHFNLPDYREESNDKISIHNIWRPPMHEIDHA
jgi:hypothetical protein